MTVVLVHGNPEINAVWTPLVDALAALGRTDVAVVTAGFRCAGPVGLACQPGRLP